METDQDVAVLSCEYPPGDQPYMYLAAQTQLWIFPFLFPLHFKRCRMLKVSVLFHALGSRNLVVGEVMTIYSS